MNQLKTILSQKLKVLHLTLVLALTVGLTFGLIILSLLLGWACCIEPATSDGMYSHWTLFGLFTVDGILITLGLYGFYINAQKKQRPDYQKSYLIAAILVILAYFVFMPIILITNP